MDKIENCPVLTTVQVIGGKWKPRILWSLRLKGKLRFGELKREMPKASEKMLTSHLRELEDAELIHRLRVDDGNVVNVIYSISDYGKSLEPILDSLAHWGMTHQLQISKKKNE